jgi:CheY-like chemotaxis protein
LKQTQDALREADRRKDEFLATLAHELRNPLAPIRHAVKLLELPAADERQRQWGRDVIARQVQRMALLLDDLLEVSRITRGRLELKKTHVDLPSLIAAAVETARPLMESKQHSLETALPPEPIGLEVDPLRISQALSNLLTNSAKYTDVGGRISLTAALDETRQLAISVTDTGIGLSPQVIPRLFEMFSQVESPVDRAEGGLGIGLSLVKGLVEMHGGTVEAYSAGLGCGSRFTIRLPASAVSIGNVADSGSAGAKSVPPPRHRSRILLADDNHDAVDSLALVLKMAGYEVYATHSGLEAMDVGARMRPDVFILDIGMPEISGYELASRIRQKPWGGNALLIALTGWGQLQDQERSREAGFDHHLTKPVDPDQLERLLHDFASPPADRLGGTDRACAGPSRPGPSPL